jgi:hypothetical protein
MHRVYIVKNNVCVLLSVDQVYYVRIQSVDIVSVSDLTG